jgi:EAL domain-containing protein (putative c-di-GMP-specific phosphodiesterase class I)
MAPRDHREVRPARAGWLLRLPTGAQIALISLALLACWALVYAAGGTRTAFPHVFYIPIVAAALPFGVRGGVVVGVAAMLLAGPVMPLDVATGESQAAANWLVRGGFFIAVGALAGTSTASLRRSFRAGLTRHLSTELELATPQDDPTSAPAWDIQIRRALDVGGFATVYQPIYALADGRLIAVEALTRFETDPSPRPDDWFAHAWSIGLGVDLEIAAIAAALATGADLPPDVALSFNASPSTLCDERLVELLDATEPRPLIVEVTEHAVVDDYRQLDDAMVSLRRRGVRLAVDDAGAGFASLRHIVRLQPELIKLDPSLTQNLRDDPVRGPLADCLIEFARRTGSAIIAEGIETPADLATWRDLGAHAVQGHLLGRPGALPAPAWTGALRRPETTARTAAP